MRHNNFGICDQIKIQSKDQGLTSISAFYDAFDGTVKSELAEVGSYNNLETKNP